jgi:hypothetical protein
MKIARTETGFIRDGDEITVAVTHEIKIGGESSWVRFEAKTKVNQETCEDASNRVIRFVNQGVMDAVHRTVEEVRKQG